MPTSLTVVQVAVDAAIPSNLPTPPCLFSPRAASGRPAFGQSSAEPKVFGSGRNDYVPEPSLKLLKIRSFKAEVEKQVRVQTRPPFYIVNFGSFRLHRLASGQGAPTLREFGDHKRNHLKHLRKVSVHLIEGTQVSL